MREIVMMTATQRKKQISPRPEGPVEMTNREGARAHKSTRLATIHDQMLAAP
jgi:hypothetical protein